MDAEERSTEISMEELAALVDTAGADTVAMVLQTRQSPDPRSFLGAGKLQEIKEIVTNNECDLVVIDNELSPSQARAIEEELGVRVVDRSGLILDIFAQRAMTKEGCIQVELAQNKYRLAHLAGRGIELSRLGGGIGTRGPGESKLETDRRHIRKRIEMLENQLKKLEKRRKLHRERRRKDNILTGAIVGYTNVGKSTLLNALTDAGVLAENKLFATLDITSRMLELPDGRSIMLVDTVGLIRRLPHQLVEAFKSTLEEAASADIIINIVDISAEDGLEQAEVTASLLNELCCEGIPKITVYNKSDAVKDLEYIPLDDKSVLISAKNKTGFDGLLDCISRNLPETAVRGKFLIPYDKTSLICSVRTEGKVFAEEYTENGTLIEALVDRKLLHLVKEFEVS